MNRFLRVFFTSIALLSPILNVYGISSTFHTFTLREFFIVIFIFLAFFGFFQKDNSLNKTFQSILFFILIFAAFFLLSFFINLMCGNSGFELRAVRFYLLLLFVFVFGPRFFDYNYGLKLYKFLVVFVSMFLIAQVVLANTIGYELKGYLPFLPIRSDHLVNSNGLRRFYSVFEEPGYYGMFVAGYLCLSLFKKSGEKNRFEWEIWLLTAIASFLSTSTTAIVTYAVATLLAICGKFYLVYKNHSSKKEKKIIKRVALVSIIILTIAIVIFVNTEQFKTVMYRLNYETSTDDRFSGYTEGIEVFKEYDFFIQAFGNSLTEYPISGYVALLMCFGVVGSILVLLFNLYLFVKTNIPGKLLIILFWFLNIANVEFLGNASTLLIYYCFILYPLTYAGYKATRREKYESNLCLRSKLL